MTAPKTARALITATFPASLTRATMGDRSARHHWTRADPVRPREGRSSTARLEGPARRGDLLLDRLGPGERSLGPAVPAARVLEIALQDVHDAVEPGGEGRLLRLDDLVGLLPGAGSQVIQRTGEGIGRGVRTRSCHGVIIRQAGRTRNNLRPQHGHAEVTPTGWKSRLTAKPIQEQFGVQQTWRPDSPRGLAAAAP